MSLKQKTIKLNQDQNSNAIKLSVEFTTDSSSYTMPFVIVFLRDLTGARELIEFLMTTSANWIHDIREYSPVTYKQRYYIIMLMGA